MFLATFVVQSLDGDHTSAFFSLIWLSTNSFHYQNFYLYTVFCLTRKVPLWLKISFPKNVLAKTAAQKVSYKNKEYNNTENIFQG